jgi:peptide chain release factor subunit 1
MSSRSSLSEITPSEWLSLNQFVQELKEVNSQCISVYYPYGKGKDTIQLLQETNRSESLKKIEHKIENKILELKKNPISVGKFTKTLCIFGWIKNEKIQIKVIGTSKKLPYVYMVAKKPYLKPFSDILKTNYGILLVTVDQKTARIQKFYGNQIIQESKLRIDLQGRHKKGGQSQGRFLRARQTKIHVFFKMVANRVRLMDADTELILLGGNGPGKTEFYDELNSELTSKCRFVEGLSFTTSINDIHKIIIHHLYEYRKKHMEELIQKYEKLVKDGLTAKRNNIIYRALKMGSVETLIVSANYHTNSQFKNIMKMLELAKKTSCRIEFATLPKIIKKLELDDSVLAILRYRIK